VDDKICHILAFRISQAETDIQMLDEMLLPPEMNGFVFLPESGIICDVDNAQFNAMIYIPRRCEI
jgi:hypothetical protein